MDPDDLLKLKRIRISKQVVRERRERTNTKVIAALTAPKGKRVSAKFLARYLDYLFRLYMSEAQARAKLESIVDEHCPDQFPTEILFDQVPLGSKDEWLS